MTKQDSPETTQTHAAKKTEQTGEPDKDLAKKRNSATKSSDRFLLEYWLNRLIDFVFGKYYIFNVLVLLLIALYIFSDTKRFLTDTPFWTMLLFGIAALQLGRKFRNDRTAFLENYASKFFTDERLFTAFYELVYTYDNKTFDTLDRIKEEKNNIATQGSDQHRTI